MMDYEDDGEEKVMIENWLHKTEYRKYEKCMWLVLTLNLCNLTAIASAKRVEPQGEMRWKLFGNIVFLFSLFK